MKRIQFTTKELDLIIDMCCIADAGTNEGDYQGWNDSTYKTLDSLSNKAAELLRRKRGK